MKLQVAHFTQTHFVCENTVDTLLVQVSKPCETFELILLELRHKHLGLFDCDRVSSKCRVLEIELVAVHYSLAMALLVAHCLDPLLDHAGRKPELYPWPP